METYAGLNAKTAPPRRWDGAVPVGWNSWGALQFSVNHDNATEVACFLADSLMPRSFHNADGLVYTGLDSGWDRAEGLCRPVQVHEAGAVHILDTVH